MKLLVGTVFLAAGMACCGLGPSDPPATPSTPDAPAPDAPAAPAVGEATPVRPAAPATPPGSRPAVTHPPLRYLEWQIHSVEDHTYAIWISEHGKDPDPLSRGFGDLVIDDVERWVFAKDGRFVIAQTSGMNLLLDVVHGTSTTLPSLPDEAEVGFDAADNVIAATWKAPPDTICTGKAAACRLEGGAWTCGTPVDTCGTDWDPACDCEDWPGRPQWADVRRGAKVNHCGPPLGVDASPQVLATFPTPVGLDWRVAGGDAPWAYWTREGDCGSIVTAPVLFHDGTNWFDAFPDVPTGEDVNVEVDGPWMIRYTGGEHTVYDLASTTPQKPVTTLFQGTLWPSEVPLPAYEPVAEAEPEPKEAAPEQRRERMQPHPRDRPRPRRPHPRRGE